MIARKPSCVSVRKSPQHSHRGRLFFVCLFWFIFWSAVVSVCCFCFAFGIRHRDGLSGLCTGPPSARPLVFFLWPAPCAFRRVTTLRLTRLPRHDRGAVPGGNRSAASCLCTVLRRALYHYATRSPSARPLVAHLLTKMDEFQCTNQCKTCAACKYSVWIDLANAKRRRKEQKGFFRPSFSFNPEVQGFRRQFQGSKWGRFRETSSPFFLWPAPCAFRRVTTLRLTRLPRHDRGPVPGGNRSAASCLCTVLRRALYHYATRSPSEKPAVQWVSEIWR